MRELMEAKKSQKAFKKEPISESSETSEDEALKKKKAPKKSALKKFPKPPVEFESCSESSIDYEGPPPPVTSTPAKRQRMNEVPDV